MTIVGTYVIICEGASECNYLAHLNRFLASLPMPENAGPLPLRFIARPKNIDLKSGVNVGCGGGDFGKVSRSFRTEWSKNKAYPFGVWVDADLYVRNDRENRCLYESRPAGVPPFDFSVLNFEDFLALHYGEEEFQLWRKVLSEAGHFQSPLHWDDYKVRYLKVFPDYVKNRLPVDFLNVTSLMNLFTHIDVLPVVDLHGLVIERTFAGLLKNVLKAAYPSLWRE